MSYDPPENNQLQPSEKVAAIIALLEEKIQTESPRKKEILTNFLELAKQLKQYFEEIETGEREKLLNPAVENPLENLLKQLNSLPDMLNDWIEESGIFELLGIAFSTTTQINLELEMLKMHMRGDPPEFVSLETTPGQEE